MKQRTVYVIGAGLAGLSAAVGLAARGAQVELIEAANQAGGRCRSYFDVSLGRVIDNGNHLVLSGNHDTLDYLRRIGAEKGLAGPEQAAFWFADARSGVRWKIAPNDGFLPWWIFSKTRRVPETRVSDYVDLGALAFSSRAKLVHDVVATRGVLWENLTRPFLLAALNTEPDTASAALAGAVVRETLAKGGRHYRPRVAHPYLSAVFVEPALAYLKARRANIRLGQRVRRITPEGGRIMHFEIGDEIIALTDTDRIVLATPPWVTQELLPGISAPDRFCAIVNAHFLQKAPAKTPAIIGIVRGTAEWVFAFEDRISVTVSGADRLVDRDRETLARMLWNDVSSVYGITDTLPPWQVVKEKRATFAATPDQARKRPDAATAWPNLVLAGDWTDTGLPATIEGAVRSGHKAAELVLRHRTL